MNANELRIGNKVLNQYGDIETITELSKIIANFETGCSTYGIIEPIPLTEDWLIKFGFKKNKTHFYEKGRFVYRHDFGWKILENWVKDWVGVAEIKYVHQLQNLYFALMGKELTI
jgi:hypothetical protein